MLVQKFDRIIVLASFGVELFDEFFVASVAFGVLVASVSARACVLNDARFHAQSDGCGDGRGVSVAKENRELI